jgi:hypothetical protein
MNVRTGIVTAKANSREFISAAVYAPPLNQFEINKFQKLADPLEFRELQIFLF